MMMMMMMMMMMFIRLQHKTDFHIFDLQTTWGCLDIGSSDVTLVGFQISNLRIVGWVCPERCNCKSERWTTHYIEQSRVYDYIIEYGGYMVAIWWLYGGYMVAICLVAKTIINHEIA